MAGFTEVIGRVRGFVEAWQQLDEAESLDLATGVRTLSTGPNKKTIIIPDEELSGPIICSFETSRSRHPLRETIHCTVNGVDIPDDVAVRLVFANAQKL